MTFTLIDVILIAIILFFGAAGVFFGFIGSVGSLIGLFVGAWAAGRYFSPVADWLTPIMLGHSDIARVVAFIAIFILINRLIGLVFYLVEKMFNIIAIIPFLKSINRLAGLILGLIEGALVMGLVIYALAKFTPAVPWLSDGLNNSMIAHYLVGGVAFLSVWLLPEALIKIKSVFK
ncbi:MAG: CvpA family protein [Patescibacteria group bacterium]|jgi:membrane protein required for colicin V production